VKQPEPGNTTCNHCAFWNCRQSIQNNCKSTHSNRACCYLQI